MNPVTVRLFDTIERGAAPLAEMDINPRITALSWTSTLPGGCNTLSVGVEDPDRRAGWGTSFAFIPEPIGEKAFSHVEVSVGATTVWEGRLVEQEIGPAGVQGFIAEGYGISGVNTDYFDSTSSVATTTGTILGEMLTANARLLSRGTTDEWTDPAIVHTRAEFDDMTIAEALDQVLAEGGTGWVTWDWWVTIGRRLALMPRVAPAMPDYVIPYQPQSVSIRRDFREIATSAVVAYTSQGVEFETASETRGLTVNDYRISRRIKIWADELTATGAQQLRTYELEKRAQPVTSVSITRDRDDWLTSPGGIGIPHWAVTAGQWVKVADLDPLIIVRTSFDPSSGLSLDLGAPSRASFATYLAQTCVEVSKLAKAINPKTGGRRRGIRQGSAVTALTNANGTYDGTVADVTASHSQTILNSNFRDLSDTINSLRTQLSNAKIIP